MSINKTEFKGKIIGMILGDGYLSQSRKNAYLKLKHSDKQKKYLEYKSNILQTLTSVNMRSETTKLNGKEFLEWVCETKSHPIYTKLRDHFYYHGRKTIDPYLMKSLSKEGLAYWFGDDGTWWGDSTYRSACFCTDCFNRAEHDLIIYWLAKQFDLHFTARKYRKSLRLYLRTKDTERFCNLIKPFTIDEMQYKLDFNKIGPTAIMVECQNCGRIFPVRKDKVKNRKFCSNNCTQKYLYKMGLSSIQHNVEKRA